LLRKSDLSPLGTGRMAETDGKEFRGGNCQGYEYEKGTFCGPLRRDFRRADVSYADRGHYGICALEESIPCISTTVLLEPQKAGAKAYALLPRRSTKREIVIAKWSSKPAPLPPLYRERALVLN